MKNLNDLILKAQDGDLAAFGDLVRRFQNYVYGYGCALLGDCHLAEDVAQEVFLEVFRRLPELRAPEAFSVWVRKIAFKHCDRVLRRKRVEMAPIETAAPMITKDALPDMRLEQREQRAQVAAMIRSLPKSERVVITLFYMQARSLKEVAHFLDVSVPTVKNRLHVARKRLKERMMHMVDTSLNAAQLPERFADVVVQMQFVLGDVNPLKERLNALTEEAIQRQSAKLRRQLAAGQARDAVKAEAFALVREASLRALGMAHYDVQLVAGLMLDEGWVTEMASGEGKSLACLPPVFMAVLKGNRVHVATVNDYLAKRDAAMAAQVFSLLGVTVGVIGDEEDHRAAYGCDVVYGSYTAFAFDRLRDGLRKAYEPAIQGARDFAIVDEIDQVLIDEGRTPMMIAEHVKLNAAIYRSADRIAQDLMARQEPGSDALFERDAQHLWSIRLTDAGVASVQAQARDNAALAHQVVQALRAHLLYEKDRDYVVQNGWVMILNSSIGRPTKQRWSEGLHQAVEVKEGVPVRPDTQVKERLLIQDYFKAYGKLAGLTGTAQIHAEEFRTRYGLTVGVVPTRRTENRVDYEDRIYADTAGRNEAIVAEILHCRKSGRPVLVGMTSLKASERISEWLTANSIKHQVLNARPERAAQEVKTVLRAGQRNAVTVVTAMGGRGTDIRLSERALRAGGLHVVGVGRNTLRHLDDQLKARAGRQGEPGSSRFLLCRDDELVQAAWNEIEEADRRKLQEKGVVENRRIVGAIARVQARIAARKFDIRHRLDEIEKR